MSQDLTPPLPAAQLRRRAAGLAAGHLHRLGPGTSQSVVNVGGVAVYTNAPILASALATMTTGPVLIAFADGGPIILGRLVIPTPTV
jgi:hypothetical protein